MSEPSYETALPVATQRNKLAVAQIKSNDSLTPAARRQAFAKADADYVAARQRAAQLFAPRERMLIEAAERLQASMKEAKKSRPRDMKAIRLASRRYLSDFEEAWRRYPRTAEEEKA